MYLNILFHFFGPFEYTVNDNIPPPNLAPGNVATRHFFDSKIDGVIDGFWDKSQVEFLFLIQVKNARKQPQATLWHIKR